MDGGKDSFPLAGVFSTFIAIRLLRDNEEAVIEDYPTSLEIWFVLEDKSFLRIILLPILMCLGLICRTWAFLIVHAIGSWGERIGLPSWAGARAPGVSPGLPFPWALASGPPRLFSNPINSNHPKSIYDQLLNLYYKH